MPLECLTRLIGSGLPAQVQVLEDIDKVRILVAAGLATADLPKPGEEQEGAILTGVTAEGRAALVRANMAPPSLP